MKVKQERFPEGFGAVKQFRVLEIKDKDPIPLNAFRVADETPVTDWKDEER